MDKEPEIFICTWFFRFQEKVHLDSVFYSCKTVNVRNPYKPIISLAIDTSQKYTQYLSHYVLITCANYVPVLQRTSHLSF